MRLQPRCIRQIFGTETKCWGEVKAKGIRSFTKGYSGRCIGDCLELRCLPVAGFWHFGMGCRFRGWTSFDFTRGTSWSGIWRTSLWQFLESVPRKPSIFHLKPWVLGITLVCSETPITLFLIHVRVCDQLKDGLGFVWFPGQLPFYIKDCSKISLCCAEDSKIFANCVSENVPFFSMNFDFIPGMPAKAVADPGDIEVLTPPELAMEPVVSAVEPDLEGGAESSSIADVEVVTPPELAMEPVVSAVEPGLEGGAESSSIAAKVKEVAPDVPLPKLPESTVHARAEAVSIKHRISHFPKHPLCDICNRAKLFSKRVKSHRVHDPESDLPVPTAFGEQIAIDHMIVSKSAGGREFLALIVFDCFSGIVNAYPAPTKGSDFVYSCLRHFVGMRYKNPDTVCRSDAAPELIKAIRELGWLPETSLPRRWPHNSRCERAIRSFEECCICRQGLRFCLGCGSRLAGMLLWQWTLTNGSPHSAQVSKGPTMP